MDPQNAMFEVSCLSAGALGSSTVSGPGQEQLDKVLRGFGKADSDKPHGMVLISGPIYSNEPETTGFASLFRHRRNRRHIIHRHPVPFFSSSQGSEEGNHPSPTALLEVMKIRERIVVDEQNRPKSAELALSNDLMQIDPISGQIKMLRHGEIHIKPKTAAVPPSQEELRTGAGLIKSVGPNRTLLATEFGADGEPIKMPLEGSRLDRFIRYLHLDQFWPLFIFSAVCGFSFVGLTFLAAKLILGLIDDNEKDSYEPIPNNGNLLDSIESAQPIKITNEMIQVNENTSFKHGE